MLCELYTYMEGLMYVNLKIDEHEIRRLYDREFAKKLRDHMEPRIEKWLSF